MERRVNDRTRLVVIGGDAGGMSAASQARRRCGPDDLEIVALERGDHTSYSACGIPYLVGGTVPSADELIARDPATFIRDHAIDVRTGTEATDVDLDRRVVRTVDAQGAEREERFDRLMIATGAVPIRPDWPGSDAEGIFGVQTLADGIRVREYVDERRPRRAVVVGGGYIGLEMAEAFLERGMRVDLVEAAPEPMGTLDPDMGRLVREAVCAMGVEFHPGAKVTGFETAGGRVSAVVTEQAVHEADIVVLGMGVRPDSDLARRAGLRIGPTGGIAVDRRMRTSASDVWAAGDCVETFHRVSRAPVAIALGTHANKQGRVAGTNIGGGYAHFAGVVGTAITKICGLEVSRTGLNEKEAQRAGFEFETVTVESTTRAGYYPGATTMCLKLLAERRTGRLLGGQIVGRENAGKRVDVLATALWNDMSVEEVSGMDLGYAPPFSPVWDPVLIAARKLSEKTEASPG
ncbi:NADPH-dependent 2,4-dienoyl-CoA reductase/sulfur reductase-like enzyme [Spinactinospora alkalitolerans]|uniref:NADPH-dependent 2,4-dienoyl-CoA reductase/sulfur reductase-like enzyme n=1 Tax=Spinactinospora alkalitolerans TaxID=687207 RepID=A0A852TMW5_9ACTN|nr:FAD-dependent oxidoreductase [Spinactinospora alkalitolerans]NYE44925.1 NADPH-dependent 2,4-dienoyl-CoA reductase/sulfur reductase-like enzyme [Spinactinospora alkalitolerans]